MSILASAQTATGSKSNYPFIPLTEIQRAVLVSSYLVILGAIGLRSAHRSTPSGAVILSALVLYVFLSVVPLFVRGRDFGWFHPLIFGSVLGLFGLIRSFSVYSEGLPFHRALAAGPKELNGLLAYELIFSSIAMLALYAGYFFGPRVRKVRLRLSPPVRRLPQRTAWIVGIAFSTYLVVFARRGGIAAHLMNLLEKRSDAVEGVHYPLLLVQTAVPACWIWLAARRAERKALFWVCLASSALLTYLASGSRSSLVTAFAGAIIVWSIRERKVPYVRMFIAVLTFIYLLTVLGDLRKQGGQDSLDVTAVTGSSFLDTVASGLSGELAERSTTGGGTLPILARVPHQVSYLYGSSYLAVLTTPIPRGLWPQKPGLIGGRVGRTFFGIPAGIPPGGVGEAYWNFGALGVGVVFFLFGMFQRWQVEMFKSYADSAVAIVFYVATLLVFRDPTSSSVVKWLIACAGVIGSGAILGCFRRVRSVADGLR